MNDNLYHDNPEARRALEIVEFTGINLFLTGNAGSGKTTFLKHLRERSLKRMVVLAPTGIAAINANGSTIHSFFQIAPRPFVPGSKNGIEEFKLSKEKLKIIRSLDLVVIDEISMVRADLLDQIDEVLRRVRHSRAPFGGVQLLLIGDLQQLPPVVKNEEQELLSQYYTSPYFFSSLALQSSFYVTIELTHIYRQSDATFIALLNALRSGHVTSQTLEALNKRYIPDFKPAKGESYVRLVTHNAQADAINRSELKNLKGKEQTYEASVNDNFPESAYPTELKLTLKEGAQVMFIKNDTQRRYFNGMLGTVTTCNDNVLNVQPQGSHFSIEVPRETWTNSRYVLNKDTKELEEKVEGTFTQYPLRLAWAITVHKSQGLTFNRAIIDVERSFTHGQTYVALSRCRSLEGLVLSRPIPLTAVISDISVERYLSTMLAESPDENAIAHYEKTYVYTTLTDLFGFTLLADNLAAYQRIFEEYFYSTFPQSTKEVAQLCLESKQKLVDVSERFHAQLSQLITADDTEALNTRIRAAAGYFLPLIQTLANTLRGLTPEADNKQVQERVENTYADIARFVFYKIHLLTYVFRQGFSLKDYLHERAVAAVKADEFNPKKADAAAAAASTAKAGKSSKPEAVEARRKVATPADVKHPALYRALITWRYEKSKTLSLPAYTILHQKALINIANACPTNAHSLLSLGSVGKATVEKYGEEILKIVADAGEA